jgi:omega-6 fatty acid desaturase (delta-12 desaturase)
MVTVVPFLLLWLFMWSALNNGYWIGWFLVVPTAGFLVRLFIIQHDCGHGSFFRYRSTNDWIGRAIGVVTLTPYDYWRRSHALHHASSGNLDSRGMGDILTLTVSEFRSRSFLRQLCYRLYRHPLVMFGLGPAHLFLLSHRLPTGMMRGGWRLWLSVMATNAGIATLIVIITWFVGLQLFLLIHLPVTLLAASIGVWLFYVQHQFEHTSWKSNADWTFHDAALHGSSHYELPHVLAWLTGNIGVHHVHHLSSRVPCYRLPEVLRDFPELRSVGRIGLAESLKTIRLTLWDEEKNRLVSFREALKTPGRHQALPPRT